MSTRITEVSIGDTQLVRVAEFEEDWPLSITVKYEKTAVPPPLFMPVDAGNDRVETTGQP